MHRWHVVTAIFVAAIIVSTLFLLRTTSADHSTSSRRTARENLVAPTAFNDAMITSTCDRAISGASQDLLRPSAVSRIDGIVAVIFKTSSKYSACIVAGAKDVMGNQPTLYVHSSKAIHELESFGTLNKIAGPDRYTTNTWFVVKVGPGVSVIKASAIGFTQSTSIKDGFAFVHIKEKANVRGKFVFGTAAAFSAGGSFMGSTTLG